MAGGYVAFLNHCYNNYNYMPHNYRLTKQVQFVQLFGAEHQKRCLELNANIGMLTCWKWCYCACSPHIPCVWSCAVRVMSAWPQRVCACKAGRERDADKQKAAGLHPLGPRSCLTDSSFCRWECLHEYHLSSGSFHISIYNAPYYFHSQDYI